MIWERWDRSRETRQEVAAKREETVYFTTIFFFSPPKMARKKWRDRAYLMQIVLNTTCFKWVSPLVYASQSYNSMIQLYRTTTKATVEVSYINSKKNYTHSFYSIAILDFKLKLNIFLFSTTEQSCKTISPSWAHLCSVQQVWTI